MARRGGSRRRLVSPQSPHTASVQRRGDGKQRHFTQQSAERRDVAVRGGAPVEKYRSDLRIAHQHPAEFRLHERDEAIDCLVRMPLDVDAHGLHARDVRLLQELRELPLLDTIVVAATQVPFVEKTERVEVRTPVLGDGGRRTQDDGVALPGPYRVYRTYPRACRDDQRAHTRAADNPSRDVTPRSFAFM